MYQYFRRQTSLNWFVESVMEQKHNLSVCVCVCACAYTLKQVYWTLSIPFKNNRRMEITLINKHVANKKIIMNLHVQPRSLKIDHFN